MYSKIAHAHIVSSNLMAFRIATLQAALFCIGTCVGAVGWGTALQAGRSRVRFLMVPLELFIDIILPAALWPWGWLSFQQKWVPGIFPGGKGGRCIGLKTLPPLCADCHEIWEPHPSGTLRVCPGLYRDCFTFLYYNTVFWPWIHLNIKTFHCS